MGRFASASCCASEKALSIQRSTHALDYLEIYKRLIEIENQSHIRAQSSLADNRTRVLMRGDAFAVFDRHGDLHPIGLNEQGLFYREARHLSKSVLRLAETQLLLLSSTVRDDNALLSVDLINPDLQLPSGKR